MLAGGNPETIPLEDATDLSWMMVALGRHIHPNKWVETWAARAADDAFENALNSM